MFNDYISPSVRQISMRLTVKKVSKEKRSKIVYFPLWITNNGVAKCCVLISSQLKQLILDCGRSIKSKMLQMEVSQDAESSQLIRPRKFLTFTGLTRPLLHQKYKSKDYHTLMCQASCKLCKVLQYFSFYYLLPILEWASGISAAFESFMFLLVTPHWYFYK